MPKQSPEYFKGWYSKNLERERTKRREYARTFRKENPERRLLAGAKNRARERGLEFNLELSDIIIPKQCPILGVDLVYQTWYAPSLDRIKPELGYVKGNVWVISRKANLMKNDATKEELERFAEWVKTYQH